MEDPLREEPFLCSRNLVGIVWGKIARNHFLRSRIGDERDKLSKCGAKSDRDGARIAQERSGPLRSTQERPGARRRAQERTGALRSTHERPGALRSAQERTGAPRSAQEREGALRSFQERSGALKNV